MATRKKKSTPRKKTPPKKVEIPKRKWWQIFSPRRPGENILQWAIRQLYLVDSSGNPSITVTILFYVMGIVGVVIGVSIDVALSDVTIMDGEKVITQKRGFSPEIIYLVAGLSVIINMFFKAREGLRKGQEGDDTFLDTVAEKAKEKMGELLR